MEEELSINVLMRQTFQMMLSHLQNRRSDLLKELDAHFSSKKMAMNVYQMKAQETANNLRQVSIAWQ